MVFVMQPDIVGQDIERTVVRIRLWRREIRNGILFPVGSLQITDRFRASFFHVREEVMLGYEMACAGMEGAREERAGN